MLELPGASRPGDLRRRDRTLVERDLHDGVISTEEARDTYGLGSAATV